MQFTKDHFSKEYNELAIQARIPLLTLTHRPARNVGELRFILNVGSSYFTFFPSLHMTPKRHKEVLRQVMFQALCFGPAPRLVCGPDWSDVELSRNARVLFYATADLKLISTQQLLHFRIDEPCSADLRHVIFLPHCTNKRLAFCFEKSRTTSKLFPITWVFSSLIKSCSLTPFKEDGFISISNAFIWKPWHYIVY